jgi:hypothetical protein
MLLPLADDLQRFVRTERAGGAGLGGDPDIPTERTQTPVAGIRQRRGLVRAIEVS